MATPAPSATPGDDQHEHDGRALLVELMRVCARLASGAGIVIREVQQARETAQQAPAGGAHAGGANAALGASLKDPTDSRSYLTIADVRAQVGPCVPCTNNTWPPGTRQAVHQIN